MSEKILVTGGAGFIGSHLVEALLAEGHSVVVLDNFSSGKQNFDLLKKSNVRLIQGDICLLQDVESAVADCDSVFHLAAMNRAQRSINQPIEANSVNVDGTLNLLEACRKKHVSKFVFASSSSVYGWSGSGSENDACKPIHPYGVGKLAIEEYVRVYNSLYGLNTTSLRYVSVYGPRQQSNIDYAAVIPKFLSLALEKKPLTVYGDGEQTRHFTFVKDTVACTLAAWHSQKSIGEVFNVASSQAVSINELIQVIRTLVSTVNVDYLPAKAGEVKHNPINSSKAQKILGFKATYSFESGLKETLNQINVSK